MVEARDHPGLVHVRPRPRPAPDDRRAIVVKWEWPSSSARREAARSRVEDVADVIDGEERPQWNVLRVACHLLSGLLRLTGR